MIAFECLVVALSGIQDPGFAHGGEHVPGAGAADGVIEDLGRIVEMVALFSGVGYGGLENGVDATGKGGDGGGGVNTRGLVKGLGGELEVVVFRFCFRYDSRAF